MIFHLKIIESGSPLLMGVVIVLETSECQARKIHEYFVERLPDAAITLAEYHVDTHWKMLIGEF